MLPVFLKMTEVPVLVVGGGTVAAHKVAWLLGEGARVRLIAKEVGPAVMRLTAEGTALQVEARAFRSEDLEGVRLVIAATDDEAVNAHVAQEATRRGLWVNVVDRPQLCSFYVPATGSVGPVQLAVGTNGLAPALAGALRDLLIAQVPSGIETFAEALRELRPALREQGLGFEDRAAVLRRLARLVAEEGRPLALEPLRQWLRAHI